MKSRRRLAWGIAVASVALSSIVALAAAGSAPAAFPGRNGLIVFSSTAGENVSPQLLSITPAGKGRRNLTRNLLENVGGVWSPDGRRIAFVRRDSRGSGSGMFVMNADGSRPRRVASGWNPACSPDGSLIAYIGSSPNGDREIHVVRADGQGDRTFEPSPDSATPPTWAPDGRRFATVTRGGRLTIFDLVNRTTRDVVAGLSSESSPMWSPDGTTIAYATARGEIRLIRPDGSGERVVARGVRAVWSPDGTRLAVVGESELHVGVDRRTLVVVRADGGGAVTLSRDLGDYASWSPDGRHVAFVETRLFLPPTELDPVESTDIFIADADGGGRRRVTHEPGGSEVTQPVWSPDGKRILYSASYASDLYNDLELYAVGPNGGRVRALTRNSVNDYDPAWSPDGTRLAFARAPKGRAGQGRIVITDASGRHRRALTPKGSYASPTWSPDGKFLAFGHWVRKQRASYVFVVRADGSGLRRLVPGGAPSWSPDGRRIAMSDGDTISVVHADGSRLKKIVSYRRALRFLNAPIGTGLGSPAWSPDGKEIVFEAGTSDDEERPLRDFTTALAVRPDGSRLRVLFGPVEEFVTVDWSPDGKKFLMCGGHVLVDSVAGGEAVDVTPRLSDSCSTATWQPR
jgi:Tol biopolymer transport system component